MTNRNKITLQQVLDDFLNYGKVFKDFKPTTVNGYKSSFNVFFKDTGIIYIKDLNRDVILNFFFHGRVERKWGPVTFRQYLKHLNCVFKWLLERNLIDTNYCTNIEKPKMEHRVPKSLSITQAQLILDYSYNLKYKYKIEKFRNRAIIGTMLFAGLRRAEIINLKLNEVCLETRTIFINLGKGGKDRYIPINRKLFQILSEYLDVRNIQKHSDLPNFFICANHHKYLRHKGLSNLIQILRSKSKIQFSAHSLRHTFATLMLEGGCDIYTLSKLMGHSKITTTTIYLMCSNKQLAKSVEMHSLIENW